MKLLRIVAFLACLNAPLSKAGVEDKWQSIFGPKMIVALGFGSLCVFDGIYQAFGGNSNNTVFPRLIDNQQTEGLSKIALGTAVVFATLSSVSNR